MKKALIYVIISIMMFSVSSCKVKPQSSGNSEQMAGGESGQIVENTSRQITFTDETDKYLGMIGTKPAENTTRAQPTTKIFEFDGQKLEIKFKEKQAIFSTWYKYNYTDSAGVIYSFYEDDGFLGIYNPNAPSYNEHISVTQEEALEIAKDYANNLFPNEFKEYVLYSSKTINSQDPVYSFMFSKKYGKGDCLNGEICSVDIYKDGKIKECDIQQLYVFETLETSIVENISQNDVDKIALELLAKKYDDTADWTVTETSPTLQYRNGNWVINLIVEAKNNNSGEIVSEFGFFEIN